MIHLAMWLVAFVIVLTAGCLILGALWYLRWVLVAVGGLAAVATLVVVVCSNPAAIGPYVGIALAAGLGGLLVKLGRTPHENEPAARPCTCWAFDRDGVDLPTLAPLADQKEI